MPAPSRRERLIAGAGIAGAVLGGLVAWALWTAPVSSPASGEWNRIEETGNVAARPLFRSHRGYWRPEPELIAPNPDGGPGRLEISNDTGLGLSLQLLDFEQPEDARRWVFLHSFEKRSLDGIESGRYLVRYCFGTGWSQKSRKFSASEVCQELPNPVVFTSAGVALELALDLSPRNAKPNGRIEEPQSPSMRTRKHSR